MRKIFEDYMDNLIINLANLVILCFGTITYGAIIIFRDTLGFTGEAISTALLVGVSIFVIGILNGNKKYRREMGDLDLLKEGLFNFIFVIIFTMSTMFVLTENLKVFYYYDFLQQIMYLIIVYFISSRLFLKRNF